MPHPRIFCEANLGPGAQLTLPASAAQHVARSLRLAAGDRLRLFNGAGGEYEAVIQRIDHGRVDVKLGAFDATDREPAIEVGLVQGLPEADKMDWVIQKSVELGVAWIQPVVCDRSVVRLSGERAEKRAAHWQRVAVAAAEQCGRNRVPEVRPVAAMAAWLAVPGTATRWMLAPGAGQSLASMGPPAGPLELLVGPEGGFSEREADNARYVGFAAVGLGRRTLRAETAPLAALAAIHALWGDFCR
jgi:16S rRNA (uracil1498-N3)-methyltransferase